MDEKRHIDRFMERAMKLARNAEGRTAPYPPVGSVIVSGDGEIVGEGLTRRGKGLHAELAALEVAGDRARDATCFATLEPCSHRCAPALIEAGVAKVVAAIGDSNPKVDGKGFTMLRDAGIEVEVVPGQTEAAELYAPFFTWIATGRPFVTLKLAATLDGKIAAPDGTSRWITGDEARAEVHDLRRRVDAVMVGVGTVLTDDPLLTYRPTSSDGVEGDQPLRVVLDSSGRVPVSAKVRNADADTLILTQADVGAADGGLDLDAVLEGLGRRGICHLLLEGGPTLASSFVEQGLVDRFRLYLAPKLIGGDAPGLLATGVKTLTQAWDLGITDVRRVGADICIEAVRR